MDSLPFSLLLKAFITPSSPDVRQKLEIPHKEKPKKSKERHRSKKEHRRKREKVSVSL